MLLAAAEQPNHPAKEDDGDRHAHEACSHPPEVCEGGGEDDEDDDVQKGHTTLANVYAWNVFKVYCEVQGWPK